MDEKLLLQELLLAADKLLQSRYADGECDSYSLFVFQDKVEEIKESFGEKHSNCSNCSHERIIVQAETADCYSRRGCLDCDVWLDPVRLKTPKKRF